MCGHGTIGVTTVVLETGMVIPEEGVNVIKIDSPAGRVTAFADVKKDRVQRVRFENVEQLVKKGMEIKYKVMAAMDIVHPLQQGLNGIYGTIFMETLRRDGKTLISKNVCIFADGQIDRSPTGTGTAGRVALHYHKGEMKEEDKLMNYSIIDTLMESKIVGFSDVAGIKAVVPEVCGSAYITGFNQLVIDPEDPLPEGFRIVGG
jgi:proline racemase